MRGVPYRNRNTYIVLAVALLVVLSIQAYVASTVFKSDAVVTSAQVETVTSAVIQNEEVEKSARLLFTGDIMLGRYVEQLMEVHGSAYPFANFENFFHEYDLVVGNFESAVPEMHTPTPNFNTQFSTKKEYLGLIKNIGFDVLSLANNHSYDYKEDGYSATRVACKEHALVCLGNPTEISFEEDSVIEVGGVRVGLLFIHSVYGVSDVEVATALTKLRGASDVQIAYVHWGTEYELVHNDAQQALAHTLIDNGIDAVIGHHPHVVQDIELYRGVPIFYSLGNFIFDQYFSDDVQVGVMVEMNIDDTESVFRVLPIQSRDTRSQPVLMDMPQGQALYGRIFSTVANDSRVDIEKGTITLEY